METNNLYIWSIKNIKSNRISIHAAQVAFFIMVSSLSQEKRASAAKAAIRIFFIKIFRFIYL